MADEVDGLQVEDHPGVLRLVLDRPDRMNALTDAMTDGLADHLERAQGRAGLRAVVISGNGPGFCAGADIGGEAAIDRFDVRALDRANRMVRGVVALDVPVNAAVHGAAAGVGCSLALACDLVVAAERATFLLPFTSIGLMPDGGATATVAASIGRARAMRMALLGEPLHAHDAYAAGLVSHLVADEDAVRLTVETVLSWLLMGPPLAYAATKRAVNAATLGHLETALERERTGQTVLLRTADAAEGMRAFTERRRPTYEGE
ncbi:MAG: enoyl-CoA hydratase-related protein [Nocardioides sp.]